MDTSREILVSIMLGTRTFPVGKLWFHDRKGRHSASFECEISAQRRRYGRSALGSGRIDSGQPDKDRSELWRRMVFNIMISNTDDHLRNHGFLYSPGRGWILSPAYDLNPNPEKMVFATAIDHTGAQNTIELALRNRDAFNLTEAKAIEILDKVKTAVANWQKTAKSLGVAKVSIERMSPAFNLD